MSRYVARLAAAVSALAKKLSRKQAILLSIAFLAVAVLLRSLLKDLLSAALLFLAGAFSTYYKRKLEGFGAIGFELVTSTTLVAGISFGPFAGALFGFATSLASVIISRDVGPPTALFIIISTVVGVFALPLSSSLGVVALGMVALAVSTLVVQAFTFFIQTDAELKAAAALGIVTNFAVNYVFLSFLAKPILAVIA